MFGPLLIAAGGIAVLLALVLKQKVPAFLALLMVSLGVGIAVGMEPSVVIQSMQKGMGGTLGFVAVVVGLGAMFGAMLEHAGGLDAISNRLLRRFGDDKASWSLGFVGFLVAIPVFFDVAFIMLVPLIHRLSKKTGKALLVFALPLLAGLAVTHAFIPPTPGPIAVADLLGADLGYVIMFGVLAGLPAMILGGPVLARAYTHTAISTQKDINDVNATQSPIGFGHAIFAVLMPLFLIVGATVGKNILPDGALKSGLEFMGHPFTALILACVYVYIAFGLKRGVPKDDINIMMTKALEPAGIVVLITGAGGTFKQVLIDSGIGQKLGEAVAATQMPLVLFAFIIAFLVRIAQGSATVSMITAAGLTAPVAAVAGLGAADTALLVIAIASGATMTSHVNDSGFWLVNQYLEQTPRETLRSWTVATSVMGVTGLLVACMLSVFV